MSVLRSAARPLCASPLPSSSRAASYARPVAPWQSKTHLRPPPSVPNPVPALYAQRVVLSDGSTFTAHTTAPTPQIIRLTRDVTNNPLWAPGTERRGLGDGEEEGRVGRFRRRFEVAPEEEEAKPASAFAQSDLDWMSEGAAADTVGKKQLGGPKKVKAAKKK